jgi:hypothetical protein
MGCHTHPYRRTGEKSQTESRKIAHRRLGVGGIQEIALGETFVFWGTFVFFLSCLVETSSLNFCEIVKKKIWGGISTWVVLGKTGVYLES